MVRVPVGIKIRERRKTKGLAQNALARRVGVSASYLNLIERGKRNIGGALLGRIAAELEVRLDALDSARERRLIDDLAEVSVDPLVGDLPIDAATAGDMAGRYPDWARALVALHRACLDRGETIEALTDRLNQDPFLSQSLHRMLTNIAAIRSTAEILATEGDISAQQVERFYAILANESRDLSHVARALVNFFDAGHARTRSITPAKQVDDFLMEHGNYFPDIEEATWCLGAGEDQKVIDRWLARNAGNITKTGANQGAEQSVQQVKPDDVPAESRRFSLARGVCEVAVGDIINGLVEGAANLQGASAKAQARKVLVSYAAAALLLPYDAFFQHAEHQRYDVDRLARRFGASIEQICHRLTSLRKPGASGVPFAFLRADPAGQISKRLALPDLALPRHGGACPLWVVHRAFQRPATIMARLARFPDDKVFLMVARTVQKGFPVYGQLPRLLSIMLACDVLHADRVIYADALDLAHKVGADPVGSSCRLCPRADCAHRSDDAIIAAAAQSP